MRVTNSMFSRQLINDLNKNFKEMIKLQNQASTGKKFTRASEDPFSASQSIRLKAEGEKLIQYGGNVDFSIMMVDETEASLNGINESIQRIKDLSLQAANSTTTLGDRMNICAEIRQLKEHIVSVLNSTYSGRNIFGGFNTKGTPITQVAGVVNYNGIDLSSMTSGQLDDLKSESLRVKLDKGIEMKVTITALDITGSGQDNLINVLDRLINELESEPLMNNNVENEMIKLDKHFDNILECITNAGSKTKMLEILGKKIESSTTHIKEQKSLFEDVEQEEVIIKYKSTELAYNATLAIGAKTIQPTLLDYLR